MDLHHLCQVEHSLTHISCSLIAIYLELHYSEEEDAELLATAKVRTQRKRVLVDKVLEIPYDEMVAHMEDTSALLARSDEDQVDYKNFLQWMNGPSSKHVPDSIVHHFGIKKQRLFADFDEPFQPAIEDPMIEETAFEEHAYSEASLSDAHLFTAPTMVDQPEEHPQPVEPESEQPEANMVSSSPQPGELTPIPVSSLSLLILVDLNHYLFSQHLTLLETSFQVQMLPVPLPIHHNIISKRTALLRLISKRLWTVLVRTQFNFPICSREQKIDEM